MRYILRRVRGIAGQVRSPQGLVFVFGWALSVLALLLGAAPVGAAIIGSIAVTLVLVGLLMVSDRAASLHASLASARQRIRGAGNASTLDGAGVAPRPQMSLDGAFPDVVTAATVVVIVADGGDLQTTMASLAGADTREWRAIVLATPAHVEAAWSCSLGDRRFEVVPTSIELSMDDAVHHGQVRHPERHVIVVRAGWAFVTQGLARVRYELDLSRGHAHRIVSAVMPGEFVTADSRSSWSGGPDVVAISAGKSSDADARRMHGVVAVLPAVALRDAHATPGPVVSPDHDAALRALSGAPVSGISSAALAAGLLSATSADMTDLDAVTRARVDGIIASHAPMVAKRPQASADLVIVATSAMMVDPMLAWLREGASDLSVVWLVHDGLDDSQGARQRIEDLGLPMDSVVGWAARGGKARAALVSFPYSRTSRLVADAAASARAMILELRLPSDDVLRVDDVQPLPPTHDVTDGGAPDLSGGPWFTLGQAARRWLSDGELLDVEEYPHLAIDTDVMRQLKDAHRGETCVIIGNGPSLNEHDLSKLARVHAFGVNGIFYADERFGERLSYYVVEDTMVMQDNLPEIRAYQAKMKLFPSLYRDRVGVTPNTAYFGMNQGFYAGRSPAFALPRFSVDAPSRVYAGQSVTIMNLQLAYWLGFTTVALIGMDFSYTVPDDAEINGNHITSAGDDPNHFHPEYFGKGKVWKDPKLDRVLANYQLAKLMYEADGRRIVNATAGGELHLFDRVDYDELLDEL
jgi:hypothetical protein